MLIADGDVARLFVSPFQMKTSYVVQVRDHPSGYVAHVRTPSAKYINQFKYGSLA